MDPFREQEVANDRLAKRIRLKKPATFKKKTHEVQYFFNEEVWDKMTEASAALS